MNSSKIKHEMALHHYFLILILIAILYYIFSMVSPFLNSIIMGVLLSFLFQPLNLKFVKITKGRKNLSALFSSLVLFFLVVIPITFIFLNIIFQGISSFQGIYDWILSGDYNLYSGKIESFILKIKNDYPVVFSVVPEKSLMSIDLESQALSFFSNLLKWLANQGTNILGGTINIFVSFFLMMVVFFVMIRDQKKVIDSCLHFFPFKHSQEKKIILKIQDLFKSVVFGNIFTSMAQGIAGAVGFGIAGFPVIFWGAAIAFSSLIPVVGTAIIWIPASIWLFITGRTSMAVFIAVWFIVVVGLLDNILRPLFIKSDDGMSPVLIFFSILGGINLWGLIGLIYGPMVFGLFFIFMYVYSIEFKDYLNFQDNN